MCWSFSFSVFIGRLLVVQTLSLFITKYFCDPSSIWACKQINKLFLNQIWKTFTSLYLEKEFVWSLLRMCIYCF